MGKECGEDELEKSTYLESARRTLRKITIFLERGSWEVVRSGKRQGWESERDSDIYPNMSYLLLSISLPFFLSLLLFLRCTPYLSLLSLPLSFLTSSSSFSKFFDLPLSLFVSHSLSLLSVYLWCLSYFQSLIVIFLFPLSGSFFSKSWPNKICLCLPLFFHTPWNSAIYFFCLDLEFCLPEDHLEDVFRTGESLSLRPNFSQHIRLLPHFFTNNCDRRTYN